MKSLPEIIADNQAAQTNHDIKQGQKAVVEGFDKRYQKQASPLFSRDASIVAKLATVKSVAMANGWTINITPLAQRIEGHDAFDHDYVMMVMPRVVAKELLAAAGLILPDAPAPHPQTA